MNESVKKRWVEALRSGDYKQGVGALHRDTTGEFCCLGVLCDLAVQDIGLPVHPDPAGAGIAIYGERRPGHEGETSYLPVEVVEWAGLRHRDPEVDIGPLTGLNDAGTSFEEIAALIEEQL